MTALLNQLNCFLFGHKRYVTSYGKRMERGATLGGYIETCCVSCHERKSFDFGHEVDKPFIWRFCDINQINRDCVKIDDEQKP